MKTELQTDILQDLVEELCGWDALEVIVLPDSEEPQKRYKVLMPYVMNDAVESYLELTGAVVQGEWKTDLEGEVTFHLEERKDRRKGLFLYQKENTVSIWFDQAFRHLNGYQYHQIGHMWRTEPGEEHIRQLVHLICVIHDKWNFIGEEACNEEEKSLYALAEFAPLRYWTPINESILKWYGDSVEGIEAFEELLAEAEMRHKTGKQPDLNPLNKLKKEVLHYKDTVQQGKVSQRQFLHLAKMLAYPEYAGLFELLRNKIRSASEKWPERIYAGTEQKKVEELRRKAEESLIQKGYTGAYPEFENVSEQIFLMEEQPFTIMESEEYQFTIMELHIRKTPEQKNWFSGKMKPEVFVRKWHES